MNRFTFTLSALSILALASLVAAQPPNQQSGAKQNGAATVKMNGPAIFPLEDLRPGMKGTARTVFNGSDTQEFGVEVLGVLPGFPGPRQSAIIARLSGSNVEKTGVFAGMSGSPVYIDGKSSARLRSAFRFRKSRSPASRRSNR